MSTKEEAFLFQVGVHVDDLLDTIDVLRVRFGLAEKQVEEALIQDGYVELADFYVNWLEGEAGG